jgi:hypothetical protein
MRWDVALFLKGYPAEFRFAAPHYFMCGVTATKLREIAHFARPQFPEAADFFDPTHPEQFSVFGFRGEADSQNAAVLFAQDCLAGIIDGLSVLLGHEQPVHAPLAILREGENADTQLGMLFGTQWTYIRTTDQEAEDRWTNHRPELFKQLWPFFDVVAGLHARSDTALARQLSHSMKMYRQGASAVMEGVEFICKWTALEGLVCAGVQWRKFEALKKRLPSLFPTRQQEIGTMVTNLWKARNEAVHEARAFRSPHVTNSHPLVGPIGNVDELFLGVATFAIAQLQNVDSVEALWDTASTFVLPDFAKHIRPGRFRIQGTTATLMDVPGGGDHLDGLFAAGASAFGAIPKPSVQ